MPTLESREDETNLNVEGASERVPRILRRRILPLAEVFSVQIMNFCGDLYGTIKCSNSWGGTQSLFKREREDSQSIRRPGDPLLLTGPGRGISACDFFYIHVDLMDKDGDKPLLLRGTMSWNPSTYHRNVYNKPTYKDIRGKDYRSDDGEDGSDDGEDGSDDDEDDGEDGSDDGEDGSEDDEESLDMNMFCGSRDPDSCDSKGMNGYYEEVYFDCRPQQGYGCVRVNYMVSTDAVEATVKVTLIIGDGEDSAHVYGMITAFNSNVSDESLLFQKARDEHIDVRSGHHIPLSRSIVAVPFNSSLIVRADLFDFDTISSHVIAKATVRFPAQISGTSEECIYGQCWEIRVNVSFDNDS
ncbi:hypothetical protein HHK36_019098 [Tetracentron sinense]|uniref:DUF6598 domain-containing protein n=1 Tax=Tetracentron sinense TaxID=13715 RepID=A0A834YVL4_TETSI|nr:hypothetical protein HHK36_019098 [Tetracentron sinense]